MNVNTLDHKCKQYKCKNVCTGTFIRYLGINMELTKLSLDNSKSGLHTHTYAHAHAHAHAHTHRVTTITRGKLSSFCSTNMLV